jgi:hypothetical protein
VGSIGEDKLQYGLRTGIVRVKDGAGGIHLYSSGQSVSSTLVGRRKEILRGSLPFSVIFNCLQKIARLLSVLKY